MPTFAALEPPSLFTMLKSGVVFLYVLWLLTLKNRILHLNPSLVLKNLLSDFPHVDIVAMGFPKKWEEEPLWE